MSLVHSSLLKTLAITLAATLALGACSKSGKIDRPAGAAQTATIAVNGMTCGSCVKAITKALKAIPGVETAKVDLKAKRATVRYRSGEVKLDALVAAINKLGYKAKSLLPGLPAT
jgi:Cu+-exporting ATPase